MAGGTIAPEHCAECIAGGPGHRTAATPSFRTPTRKLSAFRDRQPALLASVDEHMEKSPYLTLVLVCVNELCPVTSHLRLTD